MSEKSIFRQRLRHWFYKRAILQDMQFIIRTLAKWTLRSICRRQRVFPFFKSVWKLFGNHSSKSELFYNRPFAFFSCINSSFRFFSCFYFYGVRPCWALFCVSTKEKKRNEIFICFQHVIMNKIVKIHFKIFHMRINI